MATFSELRQASGFSIPAFCDKAGFSVSTLSRIENGSPVSLISAGKALKALGIQIDLENPKVTEQILKYGIKTTSGKEKNSVN